VNDKALSDRGGMKTRLRRYEIEWLERQCPAAAKVIVGGAKSPSGVPAQRGIAIHDCARRYLTHLARNGRPTDWEHAEAIKAEVSARFPELAFVDVQEVQRQFQGIVDGLVFNPSKYVMHETLCSLPLTLHNGTVVEVVGTPDLVEIERDEGLLVITDYKSQWRIPSQAEVDNNFQAQLYGLLCLHELDYEIVAVKLRLHLTRWGVVKEAVWSVEELEELQEHLRTKLTGFYAGKYDRVFRPGSWCTYCPRRRPGDCPRWKLPDPGEPVPITTDAQARKVLAEVIGLKGRLELRQKQLKAWSDEHGPVRVGDQQAAYKPRTSRSYVPSQVIELLAEHVDEIGPIHYDDICKIDTWGPRFKQLWRKLQPELEACATVSTSTRFEVGAAEEEDEG